MTRLLIISIAVLLLSNCNPSTQKQSTELTVSKSTEMNKQSDPAWVVNQIFEAAKSNNYEILVNLCDPTGEGDGDTKQICSISNETAEKKDEFNTYFKLGKVVGNPSIVGDYAKVQIKFGPNGNKDETMNLVKREDKWYLSSF